MIAQPTRKSRIKISTCEVFSTIIFRPLRGRQAVLGSETQIFGNSSSSSSKCIFEKKSKLSKLFRSPNSQKFIKMNFRLFYLLVISIPLWICLFMVSTSAWGAWFLKNPRQSRLESEGQVHPSTLITASRP